MSRSLQLSATAPWHALPDAVWLMLLRDWLPQDCDVVNAAMTEKATLMHPVMQSWNCRKRMTLRNVEKLWIPSSHQGQSFVFRVGHRGSVHRVVIGVEETDAAKAHEATLISNLAQIVPNAYEIKLNLRPQILALIESWPVHLRTLVLGGPGLAEDSGRFSEPSTFLRSPLGRLPSALTELDLTAVEWGAEQRSFFHHLELPRSLRVLRFPKSGYMLRKILLPEGLITLHMGGWYLPPDSSSTEELSTLISVEERVAVAWPNLPPTLTWLHCGDLACMSIGMLVLPSSLRTLFMHWNQEARMPLAAWPQVLPYGLEVLEVIGASLSVDQLNAYLPPTLQRLNLNAYLVLKASSWMLPPSLIELEIYSRQHSTAHSSVLPQASEMEPTFLPELMKFPRSLRKIIGLPPIDHSQLSTITLPLYLSTLDFGSCFNGPLEDLRLPSQLTTLCLRKHFNRDLKAVHFPSSLRSLKLGVWGGFKQPLLQWQPPLSLTDLYLGRDWNLPLNQLYLPPTIRRLQLDGFLQPLDANYHWPAQLEYLEFSANNFRQPFDKWNPPTRLQHLKIAANAMWDFPLDQQKFPSTLRVLELPKIGEQSSRLRWHNWPPQLEQWVVNLDAEFEVSRRLRAQHVFDPAACRCIPKSLRKLRIVLPSEPHMWANLWANLQALAGMLPHTLREVILETGFTTRKEYNENVSAILRFHQNLPALCCLTVDSQFLALD